MAANITTLPPLKAVTATDQGGVLAITASLGLVFGVISLLIRTYVRIECRASFGKDDYAAFLSMVFALVQGVLVFLAIGRGFGEIVADLTPAAMVAWEKEIYASDLFYLVVLWLTKSSIALLLMRLSRDPSHSIMARILLVASAVYFVISLFVVALRCDLSQPWNEQVPGCAHSTYARWAAVTVMDVLTEIALFVGGIWLVRDLQLPWSKKSVVVIAYGLRLPVVLAAVLRLYYLRQALYSDDVSLRGILASVCTQIELSYAVVATTMPCLRPFMSALNTGYGGGATFVLSQTTPNASSLQRSHDTAGGHSSSGTSTARAKARAAASAVMSGGGGSSGGGSSNGSKARKSTESQTRILVPEETKTASDGSSNTNTNNTKSSSSSSSSGSSGSSSSVPPVPVLAPSQTQYVPPKAKVSPSYFKATSITASKNSFGERSGAQSPTGVAVTVDISISEEKEAVPASSASSLSPTSPIYAHFAGGNSRERIGHAE